MDIHLNGIHNLTILTPSGDGKRFGFSADPCDSLAAAAYRLCGGNDHGKQVFIELVFAGGIGMAIPGMDKEPNEETRFAAAMDFLR